jgi:hypothetical protein
MTAERFAMLLSSALAPAGYLAAFEDVTGVPGFSFADIPLIDDDVVSAAPDLAFDEMV